MTYRVKWSKSALDALDDIAAYIATDNPKAASAIADALFSAAIRLAEFPTGRLGRVEGTYEKSVSNVPFIIAYHKHEDKAGKKRITILNIIHTARNWPEGEWPQ